VAQLCEQGRVHHVGSFPALEDETCDFRLDGLSSGRSAECVHALVRVVMAQTHRARAEPRGT